MWMMQLVRRFWCKFPGVPFVEMENGIRNRDIVVIKNPQGIPGHNDTNVFGVSIIEGIKYIGVAIQHNAVATRVDRERGQIHGVGQ